MPDERPQNQGPEDDPGRMRAYWAGRAGRCSAATHGELAGDAGTVRVLEHLVGMRRRMRVADMGTGCGLMAIWMARLGHEVVGVDDCPEMLAEARANAAAEGLDIEFRLGDMHDPGLETGSFDMVVAHDSTWCLLRPLEAYGRWLGLLKPGGYVAIIDGNRYLHLFDEDYRRRREYFGLKYGWSGALMSRADPECEGPGEMDELAEGLPLSRVQRPAWDFETLIGLGVLDLRYLCLDDEVYTTLDRHGQAWKPDGFALVGRKSHGGMPPSGEEEAQAPLDDADLPMAAASAARGDSRVLDILRALADQRRLAIVRALEAGMMSTSQLSRALGASPSLVSHNISILREQGIVVSERSGKEVLHGLSHPSVVEALSWDADILQFLLERDAERGAPGDRGGAD